MIKLNARNYELLEKFNKLKMLTGDKYLELNVEKIV